MPRTINDAIAYASAILEHTQHHNAKLEAEILLGAVLNRDRAWLRTWPEKSIGATQWRQFSNYVQRRESGEPVAYILEQRDFWSLSLRVTPDTLIPRPETELLVELALAKIPEEASWTILDLGTGSGAIAIAVAKERPRCRLIATDRLLPALRIARENAHHNQVSNIQFLAGNWLKAFAPHFQAEMILANPPYIMESDPHLSAGDLRFEPAEALASGPQGLDDLQNILLASKAHLKPGGWLLLEHGYHQQAALAERLTEQDYQLIECHKDYAGQPRISLAQYAKH